MKIEDYGFDSALFSENETAAGLPGRVAAVYRDRFEIVCDAGRGLARLKAGDYYAGNGETPTVGDFVLLDWQAGGESRILRTLPRKTYFSRLGPSPSGHGEQAVAANFDHVFLVQALGHDFNPRRLERYLTLAWQSGAIPAVILTKADTVEDCTPQLRAARQLAGRAAVFAVSALTGYGMADLERLMSPGKTVVLLGSSGAGKSSLVNALAGEEVMSTAAVRGKDDRGRHTTTHRQLILLRSGALVIDTPGMRELGMWDVSEGLGQSFADVEAHLGRCKFSDCRHQTEPGCAVKDAIRRGELSQARWESYLRLREEAQFSGDKAGYLRKKQQWHKDLAKAQRQQRRAPDYRQEPCRESFTCRVCGSLVGAEDAGTEHRNHCPRCLASVHVDHQPGDRASLCGGIMDAVGVWVRKNGEWAVIHRCRDCGAFSSNRIAADDNPALLMSIAMRPLASPPFPLWQLSGGTE